MKINADRIAADLDLIAGITETPGAGSSRPTFTPQWAMARDYVIGQARAAGCDMVIAPTGNVHVRQQDFGWQKPAWLSGSHIDSVPHGGKYDGVTGVVVPLEIFRAAHEAKRTIPLELVIFAEEEGTTFNLGMLGSRAWAGTLSMNELANLKNRDGVSPLEAGQPYGVVADQIVTSTINLNNYRGFIEVHVDQGVGMWKNEVPLAIVTAIAGRQQYKVKFLGVANHAGSTTMSDRHDALTAAARLISFVEQMACNFGDGTVATVGQISCEPNAINVIPAVVRLTIDFRSSKADVLSQGNQLLQNYMVQEATGEFNFWMTEELPPVPLDEGLCAMLAKVGEHLTGKPVPTTSSGALHDAAILAPLLPTAMIFVASKDGISHNPGEFSRIEDIALAAELLAAVVTG